ncbi:MAG: DNA repair protein RecN [Alphaproteobacteria bacterium]|nr:DNA repair protein RecN [Alphaproteobacteria bacterium]
MLESLSIRNIVLIEDLQISFKEGLCLLTGETGAGKSILLDALGLALGARAEARLLRGGTSKAQVTAMFSLPPTHPLWKELDDQEIDYEGGELIFRRTLDGDGKSKCFLNDQVITQSLMRQLGQDLVEVHGQFDKLLQPKSHLKALDDYGKVDKSPVEEAYKVYCEAKESLKTFQENLGRSQERQVFLCFASEEIEKLNPKPGEEAELEKERALIFHCAKMAEALTIVTQNLSPALSGLFQSHKALVRIQDLIPEKINPLLKTADQAIIEVQELCEELKFLQGEVESTPRDLEILENRLYAIRGLARKYQTEDLLATLKAFQEELNSLDHREDTLKALEKKLEDARQTYLEKANYLSRIRKEKALELQKALANELDPLKLGQATFRVHFDVCQEDSWGLNGVDRVEFYVQTNPGMPEGPLASIASGGELSRLMLALKVVLVQSGAVPTLIFDEIESGTGGAVAAAMGERLYTLSKSLQILAITHSPQIAAYGSEHLVISKSVQEDVTTTHVRVLEEGERDEEIARMLAGEEITEEARAAARRLIGARR